MLLALASAFAAPVTLAWDLAVQGRPVGTRTVTVKALPGDGGRRVLESYTEVAGAVGPVKLDFRQRFTAHLVGADPASFHSVVDQGGQASEIQGRFSAMGWTVTTNIGGRVRTSDYSPGRIDLSTADLFDPQSQLGLKRASTVRILSAETGEVMQGSVVAKGATTVEVAGESVPVEHYQVVGADGSSSFWFSPEGYLVRYELRSMGAKLTGTLTSPPPGGVDDFAVRAAPPIVERLPR